MRRSLAIALTAASLVVAALVPAAALAHQGNPNMKSVVNELTPHVPGVTLQVLNNDDRFQITNRSRDTILVQGYDSEPYARIAPDGTVLVNHNSPAFYLNTDRYGAVTVPKTANAKAAPDWQLLDKTGVFQWHDHRMHYMTTGVPASVKGKKVKTKIFDYRIPIQIGGREGAILGTLYWDPPKDGGAPVGAIVAFVVLVLLGVGAVLLTRRRRNAAGGGGDADPPAPDAPRDDAAPAKPAAPAAAGGGEAW
jgi:hypothetical protein